MRASDAPDLALAIRASLDHLRAWLSWATEDAAQVTAQEQHCRESEAHWSEGTEYAYVLRQSESSPVIGGFDLWHVEPEVFELGYWVHVDHTGEGYATSCAMALSQVALGALAARRVEIRTDAGNLASVAIPRHLGYRLDRVEAASPELPAHTGHVQVWILPSSGDAG
jgi:RimJ/RimL family protein N-acetyltransferase